MLLRSIPFLILSLMLSGSSAFAWQAFPVGSGSRVGWGWRVVAMPGSGDAVVAGRLQNGPARDDFSVLRYDATTGAELWRSNSDAIGEDDFAQALRIDADGDVVAGGWLATPVQTFAVVKLAGSTGVELWRHTTTGDVGTVQDVAVDSAGDVVAAGGVELPGGTFDFTVKKLAGATGAELWAATIVGSNPLRPGGGANGVAIDANDDVIAVGATQNGSGVFDAGDLTVVKLSGATGSEIWRTNVPGPAVTGISGPVLAALAVAIDPPTQDIVVAGSMYTGDPGSFDGSSELVVFRLSSTGSQLWLQQMAGTAGPGTVNGLNAAQDGLALAPNGDAIVGGVLTNTGTGGDLSVLRLAAADGSEVWRTTLDGSPPNSFDQAYQVAVDPSGDVLAFGSILLTPTGGSDDGDFTIVKLAGASGTEIWRRQIPGGGVAFDGTTDPSGAVLATGYARDCLGSRAFAVARVSSSGTPALVTDPSCTPICGDGWTGGIETEPGHCEDGNTDGGDGCDSLCLSETVASEPVPPTGGCVSTATNPASCEPDPATPSSPVAAGVAVPATGSGGSVSIVVTSSVATAPTGYDFVGKTVVVEAPAATAEDPLSLTFRIDPSALPPGVDASSVVIQRDGIPIGACLAPNDPVAAPDPCVKSRSTLPEGDVELVVLSSHASTWTTVVPRSITLAQATCRKEVRKELLGYWKGVLGAMQRCIDARNSGKIVVTCPDAKASATIALAANKLTAAKLAKKCPDAVIGSLDARGACAGAATAGSLETCLRTAAGDSVTRAIATEYAQPSALLPGKPAQTCQKAIASAAGKKDALNRFGALVKCQDGLEAGKLTACPDATTVAKILKGEDTAGKTVSKGCTDPIVASLGGGFGGSCSGVTTVGAIVTCERADHAAEVQSLMTLLP